MLGSGAIKSDADASAAGGLEGMCLDLSVTCDFGGHGLGKGHKTALMIQGIEFAVGGRDNCNCVVRTLHTGHLLD